MAFICYFSISIVRTSQAKSTAFFGSSSFTSLIARHQPALEYFHQWTSSFRCYKQGLHSLKRIWESQMRILRHNWTWGLVPGWRKLNRWRCVPHFRLPFPPDSLLKVSSLSRLEFINKMTTLSRLISPDPTTKSPAPIQASYLQLFIHSEWVCPCVNVE